jgi:hypothetical protein
MNVTMSMTVAVVVTAMPPEAVVHVPMAVMVVVMTMRVMMTMVTVIVVTVGMTVHGTMMTVAAAVTTTAVTAAAVRTGIGTGGDECRQADDGRSNKSEKRSTFEHGQGPFGSMWAIQGIGRRRRAAGSSD